MCVKSVVCCLMTFDLKKNIKKSYYDVFFHYLCSKF